MRYPIIIDTDPGVDDFFCIAIGAAYSDIFDLKAVTTIGGNNATEVTTRNALDILHLCKRDDVPVAAGETSYLEEEFGEPGVAFHGLNGLGNVEIPHTDKKAIDLKACDKIYEVAKECNGELILVTVGPTTNVAKAILKYPDITKMIKKIVMMGGSTDKGNITPYAEANIYHDYKAANILFKSGIPIDMIGLNVTLKSVMPREVFDVISEGSNPYIREVMQKLIDFRNGEAMHDAVAIGSMIEDYLTFEDAFVYIELNGEERNGQTVCDFNSKTPNTRVATAVNLDGYYKMMKGMLEVYR
ncbi:MAG: nucleoside hydrolase [Erysipelotrichaceae bacterium]|nr:nucleoside hydrolase [Erysipelotrichaceae bacterium]